MSRRARTERLGRLARSLLAKQEPSDESESEMLEASPAEHRGNEDSVAPVKKEDDTATPYQRHTLSVPATKHFAPSRRSNKGGNLARLLEMPHEILSEVGLI